MAVPAPGSLGVDHAARPTDYPAFAREVARLGYTYEWRYLCWTDHPEDPERQSLNRMKIARPDEVAAARAAGLDVGLIWQDTKHDAAGGRAAGLRNGAEARRQARLLGYPSSATIYFAAADYDAPTSDHALIADYLAGCAEAAAPHPIGGYGKNLVGAEMLRQGRVTAWWQSFGFSKPYDPVTRTVPIEQWASCFQRREQVTVAGIRCDVNEALTPPMAIWPAREEAPVTARPFVRARWFTDLAQRQINLLVVHSMEMDERPDTAEACANYFARTDVKASAHVCVDTNSAVDCVRDMDVAYAAPGANHDGLHMELAGRARQSRAEWLDPFGAAMLTGPAAGWLAEKAGLYRIPLEYVDAARLKAGGARGVTTHNEVRLAFGKTTHTDPGAGFPMDVLLDAARRAAGGGSAPIPTLEDMDMDPLCIPSWAKRQANGRVPFYRLVPGREATAPFTALVLAYPGVPLLDGALPAGWRRGDTFGIPTMFMVGLSARVIGVEEGPGGAVMVVAEDGGTFDVAKRPA